MIITQEKKKFTPVTIALESKEDLVALLLATANLTLNTVEKGMKGDALGHCNSMKVYERSYACFEILDNISKEYS